MKNSIIRTMNLLRANFSQCRNPMKKFLLAASAFFAATVAYAESSVTLYGGADGGITVQKLKGKSATVKFANGSLDTNMFGLTGTEGLGSGNSIFFRLEQGYKLSNGKEDDNNGDMAFNRQAYLGFKSDLGQVAFGRIGALGSYNGEYSISGSSAYNTSFSALSNIHSAFILTDWMNNTIAYQSPVLNGWTLHATYSNGVKEDSEKWSRNKHYYGLGATYVCEALSFGTYWELLDNKGSEGLSKPKSTNLFTAQASYDFGAFKLFGVYQFALHSMKLPNYTEIDGAHKGANQHALALSVAVPFAGGSAKFQTQGALGKLKDTGEKYNSYSVGAAYLYPLSKRTTLYTQAGWGTTGKAFKKYDSGLGGWAATVGLGHNF